MPKVTVDLTERDVKRSKVTARYERAFEDSLVRYFKKFENKPGKGVLFYKLEGRKQADYMSPHLVRVVTRKTRDKFFGKGKGPDVVVEISATETQVVVGAESEEIYEKGRKRVWP